jgi:hypothetical protein
MSASPAADVYSRRAALLAKQGPGLPYGLDMILHFVDDVFLLA